MIIKVNKFEIKKEDDINYNDAKMNSTLLL